MKKEITDYLLEKYSPEAIILHGSRVAGNEKENSDWDLWIVTDKPKNIVIENYKGSQLDADGVILPINGDLINTFGTTLKNAEVLYEKGTIGHDLVKRAHERYEKGRNLTKKEIENRINFITRRYNKIVDRVEDEGIVFLHVGVFYEVAVRYWFELLKNDWSLPIHEALPVIKEKDPRYYSLLKELYAPKITKEKLSSLTEIFEILTKKYQHIK